MKRPDMKKYLTVALLGTCALTLTTYANAQTDGGTYPSKIARFDPANFSQKPTECDRLASHPDDPYKVSPGISSSNVDRAAAIVACKIDVEADPENPRLRYQLARAYGYSGMGEKAMEHRMKAVAAGYPQSLFVIGYLYLNGETIAKDVCRGAELIHESAKVGRFAGLVAYPQYILDGTFDACDMPADPEELLGFLETAQEQAKDYYRELLVTSLKARLAAREDLKAEMACYLAASHPDDPDRVGNGLESSQIDLPAAITTCERAFTVSPLDARVNYNLGRVLYYSGRVEESLPYLERAADAGYRQSIFVLGYIRAVNKSVGIDLCKSGPYWEAGLDLDHPWSGYHLAEKAMNGSFKECSFAVPEARITQAMCFARANITEVASEGRVEALYKTYLSQDRPSCP